MTSKCAVMTSWRISLNAKCGYCFTLCAQRLFTYNSRRQRIFIITKVYLYTMDNFLQLLFFAFLCPGSNDQGHIAFVLSVCLSFCCQL